VNQDPLGQQGLRLENASSAPTQRWVRTLANGDIAVGLLNRLGAAAPPGPCTAWNVTSTGYYDSLPAGSGGQDCFSGASLQAAKDACCADAMCAGFSIDANGDGCRKPNANGPFTPSSTYSGYDKPGFVPPSGAADITINFADINLVSPVTVYDIWAQKSLGQFTDSFTASQVAYHDTAFLRLTGS